MKIERLWWTTTLVKCWMRNLLIWFFCAPVALAAGQVEKSSAFKQYMQRSVTHKVRRHWIPTRSQSVLPIEIKWKIHKNGTVSDVHVYQPGKMPTGEKRAVAAVLKSVPFDPLPAGSPECVDVSVQFQTTPSLHMTVSQALKYYGPSARSILREKCLSQGLSYPPKHLTIIGLKQERKLLMFAGTKEAKLIGSYPLVSYSGVLGPKLKQGDLQIPEGIYRITGFQTNSMLSLCVNYPNELDRENAAADRRTNLGGDILVHGGSQSTGCLVVSNDDMEQVFVAVADTGCADTELVIAPCDLTRYGPAMDLRAQPKWVPALYNSIKARLIDCR